MKDSTTTKTLAIIAGLFITTVNALAGDGTKDNPYTVAELNAQKDALAANGNTVWVKADLKGLGEDGSLTDNSDAEVDGKTVKRMAGLFGDATDSFVAYSWQILGQIELSDLSNTKDLLIALTYGTEGHPSGNTANPQYASNEEPTTPHFSLAEVQGALTLNIANGLRGYHIPSSYVVPDNVIAVKISAGYSTSKGAYVNYTNFEPGIVTPKNTAVVLMAKPGSYNFTLTAALNEQSLSNGNAMNAGTQAGVNAGTTKNRARFRFVADGTKAGFERNSDENCTVTLQSKDEIYLQVNSAENNFWGNYAWEDSDKKWITWGGGSYTAGINATEMESNESNTVFDLSGRSSIKPYKGIYVKGGKKVIIK